jgi:hypothetical protein
MRRLRVIPIAIASTLLAVWGAVSARSPGGYCTDVNLTTGAELAPGASAWCSVSDVNSKENFKDLDGDEVLSKIAGLPIREWNYKAQDASVRHAGPTAQDFHAAFGLGESPLNISTIDADGVALRAIQALEARSRAQLADVLADTQALADANDSLVLENAERRSEIAALRELVVEMRVELTRLRRAPGGRAPPLE